MIGKVLCRSEAGVAVFTDVRPTFCVTRQVQLRQNNIKTWLTAGADPGLGKGGGGQWRTYGAQAYNGSLGV